MTIWGTLGHPKCHFWNILVKNLPNIPHVSMFRDVLFCAIRKNSWLKFDGWITFLKPYLLLFNDDLFTSNELFFSCKWSSNNGAVGVCGCGFSSFSFYYNLI